MTTTPSPAFGIMGGLPGVKFAATPGQSLTATLDNTAGVSPVAWFVNGTDETRTPSSYALVQSGGVGQTVSWTAGAAGTAGEMRVRVAGGIDPKTQKPSTVMEYSCKWYVPAVATSREVLVAGELEPTNRLGSPTHGAVAALNAGLRGSTAALPTSFILNGQSNASAAPPVTMGFSALTRYLGADIQGWYDNAGGAFAQVVDGSGNARANIGGGGTGPGPGLGQWGTLLARRIADATVSTVSTYALAYAGQGIDYFLPASGTHAFYEDGTQHGSLNNYNLLKSYVAAAGVVPALYIWIQGEADAGVTQATYYGKIKTLFDQSRIDYPGIKWVIVGTVGNAQQRIIDNNGAGTSSVAGVFAAQKQLADENPNAIYFVDNRDMSLGTAWWGSKINGNHYSTYAGYEEVAERIFAALKGATRPAVPAVAHLDDVLAWTQRHQYRHSISGSTVSAWQGDIVANSLAPNTTSPTHVAYDAAFGYRTVIDFNGSNSESMKKTGLAGTDSWTIFAVAKTNAVGSTQCLAMVTKADNSKRAGFDVVGAANAFNYMYAASDLAFTGATMPADAVCAHSYFFVLDTVGLTVSLYVDGVLNGTHAIAGSETGMTDFWFAAFIGSVNKFSGRAGVVSYLLGVPANAAAAATAAAQAHAWAKVEYKLPQ